MRQFLDYFSSNSLVVESFDFDSTAISSQLVEYYFVDGLDNKYNVSFSHGEEEANIEMAVNGGFGKVKTDNPREVINTRIKIIQDFLDKFPQIEVIRSTPKDRRMGKLWVFVFKRAGLTVSVKSSGVIIATRI